MRRKEYLYCFRLHINVFMHMQAYERTLSPLLISLFLSFFFCLPICPTFFPSANRRDYHSTLPQSALFRFRKVCASRLHSHYHALTPILPHTLTHSHSLTHSYTHTLSLSRHNIFEFMQILNTFLHVSLSSPR